jgi:hypothetical protein
LYLEAPHKVPWDQECTSGQQVLQQNWQPKPLKHWLKLNSLFLSYTSHTPYAPSQWFPTSILSCLEHQHSRSHHYPLHSQCICLLCRWQIYMPLIWTAPTLLLTANFSFSLFCMSQWRTDADCPLVISTSLLYLLPLCHLISLSDLFLTNRTQQMWWTVIFMYRVHKTLACILLVDLPLW